MIRAWFILIIVIALVVWAILAFLKKHKVQGAGWPRLAAPINSNELWAQLYETDSLEDLNALRMRLGEENLNFIAFEQGKRDSRGNTPKAFGVAVSKAHLSRGQTILVRILS